jgi:hypothetical protein
VVASGQLELVKLSSRASSIKPVSVERILSGSTAQDQDPSLAQEAGTEPITRARLTLVLTVFSVQDH